MFFIFLNSIHSNTHLSKNSKAFCLHLIGTQADSTVQLASRDSQSGGEGCDKVRRQFFKLCSVTGIKIPSGFAWRVWLRNLNGTNKELYYLRKALVGGRGKDHSYKQTFM